MRLSVKQQDSITTIDTFEEAKENDEEVLRIIGSSVDAKSSVLQQPQHKKTIFGKIKLKLPTKKESTTQ